MNISIPFKPEMKKLILQGRKTCTSRTKQYGKEGDIFQIEGRTFELTAVDIYDLDTVSYFFFYDEGFETQKQFQNYWTKLHPRKKYNPEQRVWVHWFKEIK